MCKLCHRGEQGEGEERVGVNEGDEGGWGDLQ